MIRRTEVKKSRFLQVNNVADFGSFNGTTMSNSGNYIVTHGSL